MSWDTGEPTDSIRSYGQHYLELLAVEDRSFLGEPLRIEIETAREQMELGWLGDDEYIAVAPGSHEWLAIVHVEDIPAREWKSRE